MYEQQNDLYLWNALWGMMITSFTVGYGDIVPLTHSGRIAASICAIVGTLLTSLLTASLSNSLAWNPQEQRAINLCARENSKVLYAESAASLISIWWRHNRRYKKKNQSFDRTSSLPQAVKVLAGSRRAWHKLRHAKRKFRRYQALVGREIEDFEDTSTKIHKISTNAKYVHSACRAVYSLLRSWEDVEADLASSRAVGAQSSTMKSPLTDSSFTLSKKRFVGFSEDPRRACVRRDVKHEAQAEHA